MNAAHTTRLVSTAATRQFALSPAEWATTAVAGFASTTAYLVNGHPYLARGVVDVARNRAGRIRGPVGVGSASRGSREPS